MQGMQIKMLRRLKTQRYAGFAVLAMVISVIAGCATDGNVKVPVVNESPVINESSVVNESTLDKEPSVARLKDGREGFIITEVSEIDDASQREFDRAVAMLKEQNYGQAIDILEKIIEQSPGVTAPYIDIAIAYQRIGKQEQAEEHLKTALKLFPDHPVASNEYGLLYRRTGRFAEAREMYEKAIARFPEYYPIHRNLGILCDLYLDDPACAMDHYEIYSKARPEDKQVKLWIADLRARSGRN
jgi:tetratricopeptide (TPR) repeat protein